MALILRRATYWDGEALEPRTGDLTCDDGVITGLFGAGQAPPSRDEDIEMDLGEAFLLPGLIDAHVHLVWSGGPDPAALVAEEGEQITVLRAGHHARAHLEAGITTIRDLGSNWDIAISVARAIDRGAIEGPTVIASGRTVIMTGGHDGFWGVASDGADAVVRAVRGQVAHGAGVIKTAATGGVYGRAEGEEVDDSELSFDELSALTYEAHRRGRKVAAHALGTEGIRNAVRAGVDTVEHGVFLTDEIVADMAHQGTILCPTVETYRRIAESAVTGNAPEYAIRKATRVIEAHPTSVQMALNAGIPIIAGTDAGAPGMPHPTLVDELERLVEYGLSTHQALRAATSLAADAVGIAEAGRIRMGARADLIMLDADPFKSVGALRHIWGVVRGERLVKART
jgi:imidazolonepropionase-like amidohydrolase